MESLQWLVVIFVLSVAVIARYASDLGIVPRQNIKMLQPLKWTATATNSPAVSALKAAVNHPVGGILIFWAPYNTGKTYAMKDLVKLMQSEGERITTYLSRMPDYSKTFDEWLRDALGLHGEHSIASSIPQHAVIFIDHFEDLLGMRGIKETINELARESYRKGLFKIVIGVPKSSIVKEILDWNKNGEIRLACHPTAARWESAQLLKYAMSSPLISLLKCENEKQEVLELASRAGSPGPFRMLIYMGKQARQAFINGTQATWEQGIQDLSGLVYFP